MNKEMIQNLVISALMGFAGAFLSNSWGNPIYLSILSGIAAAIIVYFVIKNMYKEK